MKPWKLDAMEEACVESKVWLVMTVSDISPDLAAFELRCGDLVDVFTMPLTQDKLARLKPARGCLRGDRPQPRKALLRPPVGLRSSKMRRI